MERVKGIEPSSQPWQGRVLPLYHTRKKELVPAKPKVHHPASLSATPSHSRLRRSRMLVTGFEPASPLGHHLLKMACLPVPPPARKIDVRKLLCFLFRCNRSSW